MSLKSSSWSENQFVLVGATWGSCELWMRPVDPASLSPPYFGFLELAHREDWIVLHSCSAWNKFPEVEMSGMVIETSTSSTVIDEKMRKEMETWKGEATKNKQAKSSLGTIIGRIWIPGRYMMTSWENYEDFLEKLGVGLLLRKLATLGTPIVEVCKKIGCKILFCWDRNISRIFAS